MGNAGQARTASKRFIVVDALADRFLKKFQAALGQFMPGGPMHEATTLAPLSSAQALENLLKQVDGAVKHGARVVIGGGQLEALPGDKDVFGDSSVVILNTPGHTPGHHSLLVRLQGRGHVLVTGDLSHFQDNYASNDVPGFNFNRGDTLASLDRFKTAATNLKAAVVIQHDARDVAKLPVWSVAAR